MRRFLLSLLTLASISTSQAYGSEYTDMLKATAKPRTSLGMEPLLLLINTVAMQADFPLVKHFGIVALGSYGNPTYNFGDVTVDSSFFSLGGQMRWYPLQIDHGLHLAMDTQYMSSSETYSDFFGPIGSGQTSGIMFGALLGYKSEGFDTNIYLEAQAGYQYFLGTTTFSSSNGDVLDASFAGDGPMLKLVAGFYID